ncbi:hypothetical protein BV25DRAFT_1900770 [Artomyces pyxidatus]|uniref:Uncharacterized protein n=1 Tax=Artomyces pyxidatus TaxID=48021 RepID=A0ACB8SYT8_9AGAM|nr:hypothetical protein BV25DRAFT_1900770 [Artomyces pyxidatus]
MSSLEEFEAALKEAVTAKRISASKMKSVREAAMKCVENDTQLVSLLYRTHKSLPSSSKVASLYVFDALAREARSQVIKNELVGDINTQPGNSATFLLKLEGVLDGLFKDMASSAGPEGKEKTKKILDIWVKSNTFPSTVLTRLVNMLKDDTAVSDSVKSATPPDPRTRSQPIETPPKAAFDPAVQSTLMALLAQARNAAGGAHNGLTQPTANAGLPTQAPQLDPNQLELFQHLARAAAQSGIAAPSNHLNASNPVLPPQSPSYPPPSFVPPSFAPPSGPARQPPHEPLAGPSRPHLAEPRSDPRISNHNEPWQGGQDGPRHENGYRDHAYRGRVGRGDFRGRGRGRRDDRDNYYRERYQDRDRSPTARARRSRSRSPTRSRYAGRRDVKPYSPTHRPSMAEQTSMAPEPSSARSGIDEFGRDVRDTDEGATSGSGDQIGRSPSASASVSTLPEVQAQRAPLVPPAAPRAAATSNGHTAANDQTLSSARLDAFDRSTFDFTSPAAWEALGQAWSNTHGYAPSQEELMAFIVAGEAGVPVPAAAVAQPVQQQPPATAWNGPGWRGRGADRGGWRGGRGRGGFASRARGRGGYARGNGREGQEQWGYGGHGLMDGSDAIVLGESTPSLHGDTGGSYEQSPVDDAMAGVEQVGASGSMQRVDGKWMFVRAAGA